MSRESSVESFSEWREGSNDSASDFNDFLDDEPHEAMTADAEYYRAIFGDAKFETNDVQGSGWHVELVIDLAGAVEPLVARAWKLDTTLPIIAKFYLTCVNAGAAGLQATPASASAAERVPRPGAAFIGPRPPPACCFCSRLCALRCHGCRYGYFDGNAPRDTDIDVYQQASDQGAVTRGFACCQLRRILSVWIKHAFNNEHVKPFSPLSCVAPPDARPNMRCKRPSHEPGRRLRGSNQSARGLCVEH